MDTKNEQKPFESKEMEEWLDTFFLDPYISYLDETIFRIDLYDSETAFIVEALLPSIQKENIDIKISANELQIKVKLFDIQPPHGSQIKTRTVYFPMNISHLQTEATFEHDILEIKIWKHQNKE
ncbi:Hsp20/alpha crystallin family protein [Caldibacillus lycopersici]|uniref:Hsp20/alpha crystallin family protein n=1 Tax=Perspicuibacillus lycopersici TaxID=1325689 RepID=A0AAE3LNG6_9BACI|nr:Hsp20/alpha crystallin family protein [Perspicuibacillus lycopersici]MCU9614680.1 Hsp20/alpha crystallin family protein [Perspicuibacillus lycopersici]